MSGCRSGVVLGRGSQVPRGAFAAGALRGMLLRFGAPEYWSRVIARSARFSYTSVLASHQGRSAQRVCASSGGRPLPDSLLVGGPSAAR